MKFKSGLLATVFALGLMTAPAVAQDAATIAAAEALRDSALNDQIAYEFTRDMTTLFGPRPAGAATDHAAAVGPPSGCVRTASRTSVSKTSP